MRLVPQYAHVTRQDSADRRLAEWGTGGPGLTASAVTHPQSTTGRMHLIGNIGYVHSERVAKCACPQACHFDGKDPSFTPR